MSVYELRIFRFERRFERINKWKQPAFDHYRRSIRKFLGFYRYRLGHHRSLTPSSSPYRTDFIVGTPTSSALLQNHRSGHRLVFRTSAYSNIIGPGSADRFLPSRDVSAPKERLHHCFSGSSAYCNSVANTPGYNGLKRCHVCADEAAAGYFAGWLLSGIVSLMGLWTTPLLLHGLHRSEFPIAIAPNIHVIGYSEIIGRIGASVATFSGKLPREVSLT